MRHSLGNGMVRHPRLHRHLTLHSGPTGRRFLFCILHLVDIPSGGTSRCHQSRYLRGEINPQTGDIWCRRLVRDNLDTRSETGGMLCCLSKMLGSTSATLATTEARQGRCSLLGRWTRRTMGIPILRLATATWDGLLTQRGWVAPSGRSTTDQRRRPRSTNLSHEYSNSDSLAHRATTRWMVEPSPLVASAPTRQRHSESEAPAPFLRSTGGPDRKSTRLNSSHITTSYAVFC